MIDRAPITAHELAGELLEMEDLPIVESAGVFVVETMQDMVNLQINCFAAELLAESLEHHKPVLVGKSLLLVSHDHDGDRVFITISHQPPAWLLPVKKDGESTSVGC